MTAPFPTDGDLTIRGQIEDSSVPELLRSLLSSGETGLLTLRNGEFTKLVTIQSGRVTYAGSTNPDERLGESLLIRGRITARQYLEASRLVRPGRRLGGILVELDALEPDELIPAVEHQVKEIIMELFSWTVGDYELAIREVDLDGVPILNIATENLILEGIRRIRSWTQIVRGLGDIETVLVPTGRGDIRYRLDLTDEEQEILVHVNGRSTIEQICEVSYLSGFETCRALWAFQVLGIVKRAQAADAALFGEGFKEREREDDLAEIVETFNQMFGRIHGFLQGRQGQGVEEFMDAALEQVSRQYGTLFQGVDLKQYGRADFEQLLSNVADLPPEQRKSLMVEGLNELVFVIQLAVRTRYGKEEEVVVAGLIKDGFKRLGAA